MDYQFESLGDERFQQFCQALLTRYYPNIVCFPVGQPDGGRDAMGLFEEFDASGMFVFQVKFARRPQAETEPHKWLLETIKGELPKIRGLIPRGVTRYILLTNIAGTAHLDVGSIDKMRDLLLKEIPLPSECWWRDDISRRLDGAPEIRWAYPELLTGLDIIQQLIESDFSENRARRTDAIKTFLRDQYEVEKQVRFKQVELQNQLLDLFIDVPISVRERRNELRFHFRSIERRVAIDSTDGEDEALAYRSLFERDEGSELGAASFFLHSLTQRYFPVVILEGAPGQGKSTITQYLCQVHRMRLLNEQRDLALINEQHRSSPLRLPIRVDLRDLATWLEKKNPFFVGETDEPISHWHKSLEAFLAALIVHHSGGGDFSVHDLREVMKSSAVLLVFDGLDEIADFTRRQGVVDEITRGVNRLQEVCLSLQVIVTSRPAAFANSPGFSGKSFPHCQLESLTRSLITDYAEKWLKARKLQGRESAEVRKILREKLDQPHLRDLAKNPMQLAILLSLIHNRGESLPDKRTELYDSYVELFFSREAQKSPVVREHRDLLINIHRYLAWVLQSEAEEGHHQGSISSSDLERLLRVYLLSEGHDASLAQKLFAGMVERVVALVSRVEGTYEFEVQPLREYFAARYLYETAPYSPTGSPRKGNKVDRFDAISRNFYWHNVTRFYSGCYSIGELPSLADRLEELAKDEGYSLTTFPRLLAATLLADWVFTQHPKSMKQVISLILDGLGLRLLLTTSNRRLRTSNPLVLPPQCGREELILQCFSILRGLPHPDYALSVVELIKMNASIPEILDKWSEEVSACSGTTRTRWMEYGLFLGAVAQVPLQEIESALEDDPNNPDRLSYIYRARQFAACHASEERFNAIAELILTRRITGRGNRRIESSHDRLAHIFDASRYQIASDVKQPVSLCDVWKSSRRYADLSQSLSVFAEYPLIGKIDKVWEVAVEQSNRTAVEWATDLSPWDSLVEISRSLFGDKWAIVHLANVSSGVRSQKETCVDFDELFDSHKSLCRRARYARLRAGTSRWWERQLGLARTQSEIALANLVLLSWGSQRTLVELISSINESIESLSTEYWMSLANSLRRPTSLSSDRDGLSSFAIDDLPDGLSLRTATLIGMRVKPEISQELYLRYLADYHGGDAIILGFCQRNATHLLYQDPENWKRHLDTIESSYLNERISDVSFNEVPRRQDKIPLDAAKHIARHPDRYPSLLVALAESICRNDVAQSMTAVGAIAKRDQWFV